MTLAPETDFENAVGLAPGQRVLLVDDHDIVRKGLRLLLEDEFRVDVIEASSGPQAMTWAKDDSIGVVLLDLRMPEQDGLATLREIRSLGLNLPVLILSTYLDEELVQECIDAGAQGYMLKDASLAQLREAIQTALSGDGLYLHPAVAHRVLAWRRRDKHYADLLSDREFVVIGHLVEGAKNDEIAVAMCVSEKTVKAYLSSIFRKLGVINRTQAAAKAIRERIVQPVAVDASRTAV